jgi:hypothetical protein
MGIDVGEHVVPTSEARGRHEGGRHEVSLVNQVDVEEHREGGGVQEHHHAWVLRDEGPWGMLRWTIVESCADAGCEEPITTARTVEELGTIVDRAHRR